MSDLFKRTKGGPVHQINIKARVEDELQLIRLVAEDDPAELGKPGGGLSAVVRKALIYYFQHSPEGKKAVRDFAAGKRPKSVTNAALEARKSGRRKAVAGADS